MDFYLAAATDTGTRRKENQDSLFAQQFAAEQGNLAFAVLCDGMGGLEHGELASGWLVQAFSAWAQKTLPERTGKGFQDYEIRKAWTELVAVQNEKIRTYGQQNGCTLGSTVTALLLTPQRYYILNIGDSRAYEIGERARQLTMDHTILAEELRLGNLNEAQAKDFPLKHVLTRCVGVAQRACPDFFFGDTRANTVYLLCSDGFRHCVSPEEMQQALSPCAPPAAVRLQAACKALIARNKERGETDNISVITIYASDGAKERCSDEL